MKLGAILGNLIVIAVGTLVGLLLYYNVGSGSHSVPRVTGGKARLPCLANNHCPMGQKCSGGFCSEGFVASYAGSTDMSSCGAKECNGINAPCARTGSPCPEGTFCQGNSCVNIAAPNNGEAYNQIGMLLS
jgi:hypothetical protein